MVTLVYELLFVFAAASGILSVLAAPAGLGKVGFVLIFLQLATVSLIVIFKNCKLTGRLISLGILSSFAVFVIILSRYDVFMGKALENIRLLWLLLFALAAFIIGELCAYVRIFGLIVTVLSFASLIPIMLLKVDIEKAYVVSVFFLLILTLAKEIQLGWKKYGNTDLKTHMVYISPFILLIVLCLSFSPYSAKPYNWNVVKTIYRLVNEKIQDIRIKVSIRKNEDYAETLMGFSEEGEFSGDVKPNNDKVMAVFGIPSESDYLRLSGKNFSTFTGREWIDDDNDTAPDSMLDAIGLLAYTDDYTDTPENLLRSEQLSIKYIQMNTSYVFSPEKTEVRRSTFPVYSYEILYRGSDIMWPETQSYKTAYRISYFLLNTKSEKFTEFIEESRTPSEENYTKNLYRLGLKNENDLSYESYLSHKEYIYDFYCPETEISEELKTYVDKLLEGSESDYEKLLRIKDFLQTFEYTQSPGVLPSYVSDESSFLDYFILNTRRGYCNYFATAFVLLARSEGIPARYVQGYSTPTYSKSSMYITSSMAHAWAEVYFDGVGWIAFDPTPGNGGGAYWAESKPDYTMPQFGVYEPKEKTQTYIPDLPEIEEEEEEPLFALKWYMIVIPAISGLLIITLSFFIYKLISVRRFNRLEYNRRFEILCRQLFFILSLLGHPRFEYETIQEYRERLEKDCFIENLNYMEDLEKYLYDEKKNPDSMKDAFTKTSEIQKGFLFELKKKSLVKYIVYHLKYF